MGKQLQSHLMGTIANDQNDRIFIFMKAFKPQEMYCLSPVHIHVNDHNFQTRIL